MTESTPNRHLSLAGKPEVDGTGVRVLCLVPDDSQTDAALEYALTLAGNDGAVVLYERSSESWRPDDDAALEPAGADCFDGVEAVERARRIADPSETEVLVWRSITPAVGTGLLDAIQSAKISDVVLPADGHATATSDRVVNDGDSLADTVRSLLSQPLSSDTGTVPRLHVVESDPSND